jgi:hypothetical protein
MTGPAALAIFLLHYSIIAFEALRKPLQGVANAHQGGGALD